MFRQRLLEITRLGRITMVSMERREWPILDVRYMTMLDRIEPAIVDVIIQIAFVTNDVFPIAALPDATFAACAANGVQPLTLWK
jgi:hypothetical protein